MNINTLLNNNDFILMEAAVVERLRRNPNVSLHPDLAHSLLVNSNIGREHMAEIYHEYISIAQNARVPFFMCAPTWRANKDRIEAAKIDNDLNASAIDFIKHIRNDFPAWSENIIIGGLVGCKNDCYLPDQGISENEAESFHSWQINKIAAAGCDFIIAASMPALPEAIGMAKALSKTKVPYIISFVINKNGALLDNSSIANAISEIDNRCPTKPLGFMINCAYPSFFKPDQQPHSIINRIIGYQANGSALTHAELEGSQTIHTEDVPDWGARMIDLNKSHNITILGGCCGTDSRHLQYIVDNIS